MHHNYQIFLSLSQHITSANLVELSRCWWVYTFHYLINVIVIVSREDFQDERSYCGRLFANFQAKFQCWRLFQCWHLLIFANCTKGSIHTVSGLLSANQSCRKCQTFIVSITSPFSYSSNNQETMKWKKLE